MINQLYSDKLQRLPELLLTTLLGDIPAIFWGPQLRRLSCYTAKLYNPNILNSCLTGKMPVPLIQIKCTTA